MSRSLLLASVLLLVLGGIPSSAEEQGLPGPATTSSPGSPCAGNNMLWSNGVAVDDAMNQVPDPILMSANPCFVSCPNGGFIDCSWGIPGDPTLCCWKNATRCQSYNCNTGQLFLSKVCL